MQAHLDAPPDEVWALVGNPATYPQKWPIAIEIRGETFDVGDVYSDVRWAAVGYTTSGSSGTAR